MVIYPIYFFLPFVSYVLIPCPYRLAAGLSRHNSGMADASLGLATLGNVASATVVAHCLTIAAAVFYFDLRVRKEACDRQIMMDMGQGLAIGARHNSWAMETLEARGGIEPPMKVLQTFALPLGYRAARPANHSIRDLPTATFQPGNCATAVKSVVGQFPVSPFTGP